MKSKRLVQIRAGRLVTAVIYTQAGPWDEPTARAQKTKASSEARQRLNQTASWRKLELLIAANFDREDLFVTLTYRDMDLPGSREQAVRCCKDFLRILGKSRAAREAGPLRYVKNAEHLRDDGTEGRWHHHLILNAAGGDYEEIRSLWAAWGDNIEIEPLGDDFGGRARYMCKERPPLGKQTWTPSRGLRRPVRESEMVDESLTLSAPPGAVIIESDQKTNGWGSFVYLKYLLPYRPPRPSGTRKRIRTG